LSIVIQLRPAWAPSRTSIQKAFDRHERYAPAGIMVLIYNGSLSAHGHLFSSYALLQIMISDFFFFFLARQLTGITHSGGNAEFWQNILH
jgi:hypothetical protein